MNKVLDTEELVIAEHLCLARELSGLSQGQVAKISEFNHSAIDDFETGKRKISAKEIATLSEIYGISITWLTGVVDENLSQIEIGFSVKEISKLKPEDREQLLKLLKIFRTSETD